MSVMSMYRYMLQGPSSDVPSAMDINTGPHPPAAHRHTGMPSNFPSSGSAHSIFNPSSSAHSPSRNQSMDSGPVVQDIISTYSQHGASNLNTPVTQTNGNSGAAGLVVPTATRPQRTIKSYHCRMCDQEFEHKSDMQRHSKDVHGLEEKGHKCPHCFKLFPSSQQLGQHSLVHTNLRKYTCKFCDKMFKQLSHVQQHQRIHTGEKPYKCLSDACEKAFAQLSNLQNHMKQHEKEANGSLPQNLKKPFNCHVCQRRFATEGSLNNHISKLHSAVAQPHDLTCQVCEKQCYSTDKFYKHMHKYHPDYWRVFAGDRPLSDFINPETSFREKPFRCQICSKKYSHETGLSKHLITHPEFRNDPKFKGAELFSCPVCEKIFTRENYLERHMEMKHDEEHSKAYEIYKQKYLRKPSVIKNIESQHSNLLHETSQSLPTHHSDKMTNLLLKDNLQSDCEIQAESMEKQADSPYSSDDLNQTKQLHESHILSNNEYLKNENSFNKTSPDKYCKTLENNESYFRWQSSTRPRSSSRGSTDAQQRPFDMSNRQEFLESSKTPVAYNRSASVSLPVFPESIDRLNKRDKEFSTEPLQTYPSKSYLQRQMASLDNCHILRPSANNISIGESHSVTYEQIVRDQLFEEQRLNVNNEKLDSCNKNSNSKQGTVKHDHFLKPQYSFNPDDSRIFSSSFLNNGDIHKSAIDDCSNCEKSSLRNVSPNGNTLFSDNYQTSLNKHFSRTHGNDVIKSAFNADQQARIVSGGSDSRYDYPAYGRERFTAQFPFNIPSSTLQSSSFPHSISSRSALGAQYPSLSHRSEEEVAHALESIARVMRPAFR